VTHRVLVVAEHDGRDLAAATAKTLQAALTLDGAATTLVVFAEDGTSVAEQAAGLDGVERVLLVRNAAHAQPLAAKIAPQLAEVAAGFSHVFGPSTTFGKDLMPRAAAFLDVPQLSDVMSIESATRFRRPIYAGNAVVTVEVRATPVVATIRVSSYREVGKRDGAAAPIDVVEPAAPLPDHTRFVSSSGSDAGRPDLQTARRVVSGGRGLASESGFAQLNRLADLLGAAIGATRAAVDAGYAPNEIQVGQTGKIIAPELYIALGISGAIQHVAGVKDAQTIVAINKDPDAPIFEVADIGLVADLFGVLPELEQLIEKG
jgi:electron transfer flavoprotein alpha subunit